MSNNPAAPTTGREFQVWEDGRRQGHRESRDRRAIEAADKVRGGTLPMVPSAEAIDMAVVTCGFPLTSLRRSRIRDALAASYAIDGAREVPVDRVEGSNDGVQIVDIPIYSTLWIILHRFSCVAGDVKWGFVRSEELDAAIAELEALEK